jgi:membrane protein implicated in regulation of membrane protease activity
MSGDFWIFWVVVVGVTIIVIWVKTTVQRRREGRQDMITKKGSWTSQRLAKILDTVTLQNIVYGNTFPRFGRRRHNLAQSTEYSNASRQTP